MLQSVVIVCLVSVLGVITAKNICDATIREYAAKCWHRPSKRSIPENNNFIGRLGGYATPEEPDYFQQYEDVPTLEDQARSRRRKSADDIRRKILMENSFLDIIKQRKAPIANRPIVRSANSCDFQLLQELCA